jgi:hypothetical protein
MKLYTYLVDGGEHVGAEAADGRLIDLHAAKQARGGPGLAAFESMLGLIEAGDEALDEARRLLANPPNSTVRQWDAIRLAAPIPRLPKLRGFSVFERHLHQSSAGLARYARLLSARRYNDCRLRRNRGMASLFKLDRLRAGAGRCHWQAWQGYFA